jgi:hypothetical protein
MHSARWRFLLFNALGGAAVLGSYVHGIVTHDQPGRTLWGGIPLSVQHLYTASMGTATVGFLLLFAYFFRLLPDRARLGRLPLSALYVPLLLVHVASTLWMPLSFAYNAAPSPAGWAAVRIDLLFVGAGALLLIAAVATTAPRGRGFVAALLGAIAFAFQTAILDALVWPALY